VLQIAQTCHFWKAERRDPLPQALDCLAERVESGRCRRFGRYDVFFPPPQQQHNNTQGGLGQYQHAALFLPGALIAHTAYTEVAAKLSDAGICVVTVSMEPSRMATAHLGADSKRMKRIMKKVNTLLPVSPFWSIGGHSMGSFAAMRIAKELSSTNDNADAATRISRLFLWGSANFPNTRTNLRDDGLMDEFPVLIIQGSNDILCRMDAQQLAEFQNDFPADTTIYKTIDGAAHNWFASVDQGEPSYVGKASIPMNQQQEQAVALTAEFLLQV
jgi:pimeloyl-ACP methyl ester carboxylesterase